MRPLQAIPKIPQTQSIPRWLVYWKLAKYRVDVHLGLAIAWSLVPPSLALRPLTIALIALSFVFLGTIACTAIVFDDVNGFRDGSDARNYAAVDATAYRSRLKKPLVAGLLTERDAIRFGYALTACSFVLVVVAWLIDAHAGPWWLLPSLLAMVLFAAQYSYGLKLSYVGAQDVVLLLSFFGTVVLPYALITGTVSVAVVATGVLIGLWDVQVVQFSNIPDIAGDKAVGRRTMAVVLSGGAHTVLILVTFALIWIGTLGAVVLGYLPKATLVTLLPAAALHFDQLRLGFRPGRAIEGRIRGWHAMRAWSLGIVAGQLAAQLIGHLFG